jgi:hypothetical protein
VSGFDARLLVWVKPRKTQHEQIFSAVPPIADILGGLRFGFVNLQQARLLFHNHSLCESARYIRLQPVSPRKITSAWDRMPLVNRFASQI